MHADANMRRGNNTSNSSGISAQNGNTKGIFTLVYQIEKPLDNPAYDGFTNDTHVFIRAASIKNALPLHQGARFNQLVDFKPMQFSTSSGYGDVDPATTYFITSNFNNGSLLEGTVVEYLKHGHKTITLIIPKNGSTFLGGDTFRPTVPSFTFQCIYSDGSTIPVTLDIKEHSIITIDETSGPFSKMGIGKDLKIDTSISTSSGFDSSWGLHNFFAAGKWGFGQPGEQNQAIGDWFGGTSNWMPYAFPATSLHPPRYNLFGDPNVEGKGHFPLEFFSAASRPYMMAKNSPYANLAVSDQLGVNKDNGKAGTPLSESTIPLYRLFTSRRDDAQAIGDGNFSAGAGNGEFNLSDDGIWWGKNFGAYNWWAVNTTPVLSGSYTNDLATSDSYTSVYGYGPVVPTNGGTIGLTIGQISQVATTDSRLLKGPTSYLNFSNLENSTNSNAVNSAWGSLKVAYQTLPTIEETLVTDKLFGRSIRKHREATDNTVYHSIDAKASFFDQTSEVNGGAPIVVKCRQTLLKDVYLETSTEGPVTNRTADYSAYAALSGWGVPGVFGGFFDAPGQGITDHHFNTTSSNNGEYTLGNAAIGQPSSGVGVDYKMYNSWFTDQGAIPDINGIINQTSPGTNTATNQVNQPFAGVGTKKYWEYDNPQPFAFESASGLELILNRLWYGNGAAPSSKYGSATMPKFGDIVSDIDYYWAEDLETALKPLWLRYVNARTTPNSIDLLDSSITEGYSTTGQIPLGPNVGGFVQAPIGAYFGTAKQGVAVGGWQDVMVVATLGNTFIDEGVHSTATNGVANNTSQALWASPWYPHDVLLSKTSTLEAVQTELENQAPALDGYSLDEDNMMVSDHMSFYYKPEGSGGNNRSRFYVPIAVTKGALYKCTDLTLSKGRDNFEGQFNSLVNGITVGSSSTPAIAQDTKGSRLLYTDLLNPFIDIAEADKCNYTQGDNGCFEWLNVQILVEDTNQIANQFTASNTDTPQITLIATFKNTCNTGSNTAQFKTSTGSKTAGSFAEVKEIFNEIKYYPGNYNNPAFTNYSIPVDLEEADVDVAEITYIEGSVYRLKLVIKGEATDPGGFDVLPDLPAIFGSQLAEYSTGLTTHSLPECKWSYNVTHGVELVNQNTGLYLAPIDGSDITIYSGDTISGLLVAYLISNSPQSAQFNIGGESLFSNSDTLSSGRYKALGSAWSEAIDDTYIPYAASKIAIGRTAAFNPEGVDYIRLFDFITYGRVVLQSGCTDPEANNYNPVATVDDGSCNYQVFGCTDPVADNYDAAATDDDGSCLNCESDSDAYSTNENITSYLKVGRQSDGNSIIPVSVAGGAMYEGVSAYQYYSESVQANQYYGTDAATVNAITSEYWFGENWMATGNPISSTNLPGDLDEEAMRFEFRANSYFSSESAVNYDPAALTNHRLRIYPGSDALLSAMEGLQMEPNLNRAMQRGAYGGFNTALNKSWAAIISGATPIAEFTQATQVNYTFGQSGIQAVFDMGDTTIEGGYTIPYALNSATLYVAEYVQYFNRLAECPASGPSNSLINSTDNLRVHYAVFMLPYCGCTDSTSVSYPSVYPWNVNHISAFPAMYSSTGSACSTYALGPGPTGQLCYAEAVETQSCEAFWEWCLINTVPGCNFDAVTTLDEAVQIGDNLFYPTIYQTTLKVEGYYVSQLGTYAYAVDTQYEIRVWVDGEIDATLTQTTQDGLASADGSVAHSFTVSAQNQYYFELVFNNPSNIPEIEDLGPTCTLYSDSISVEPCPLYPGCTDPAALNYDAEANFDNGSCLYYDCEELFNINAGGFTEVIVTPTASSSTCSTTTISVLGQDTIVTYVASDNNGEINVNVVVDPTEIEYPQYECNIVLCPASAIGVADGGPSSQTDIINIALQNYDSLYQTGGTIDLGDAGQMYFSPFQKIDVPYPAYSVNAVANRNFVDIGDAIPNGYTFTGLANGAYFVLIIPEVSDFVNGEFFDLQECVNDAIYYLEFLSTTVVPLDEPTEGPCQEDCSNPEGCQDEVYGCTDPNNDAYNPLATVDDGSCTPPNDCDGNSNDPNCFDCTTADAIQRLGLRGISTRDTNVDPCDPTTDGEGCTDPNACNYDPYIDLAYSNNQLCDYCSCTENPEDCCTGEDCGDDDVTDPDPECPDPSNPACNFCCDTTCYDPADCPPPPDPCIFSGNCDPDTPVDDGDDPVIIDPVISFECEPDFTVNGLTWDSVKNMVMRCTSDAGARALVKLRHGIEYDEEDLIKIDLITYLFLGGANRTPLPCLFNCNYTTVRAKTEYSCADSWGRRGGKRWASTDSYSKNDMVIYPYMQMGKPKLAFFRAVKDIQPGGIHPRFKDSGWTLCGSRKFKKTDPLGVASGSETYLTDLFEYFARTCSTCEVEIPAGPEDPGTGETVKRNRPDADNMIKKSMPDGPSNQTGIIGPDGIEIIF